MSRPLWRVRAAASETAWRDGLRDRLSGRGCGSHLAADVLHRLDTADARDHVEVVGRRRRRGEPLERVALPGVVAGLAAVLDAPEHVDDGHEHAHAEDE